MLDLLVTRAVLFGARCFSGLTSQEEQLYDLLDLGRRALPLGLDTLPQQWKYYDAWADVFRERLACYNGDYKDYFSQALERLQSRVKISLGYSFFYRNLYKCLKNHITIMI